MTDITPDTFLCLYIKQTSTKKIFLIQGKMKEKEIFFLRGTGTMEPLILFILWVWVISRNASYRHKKVFFMFIQIKNRLH